MTIAPIMHGAAQWGMYIGCSPAATAVLYGAHGFDPMEVWKERRRGALQPGHGRRRRDRPPVGRGARRPDFDLDVSCVQAIGSGGALFSEVVKDEYRARFPGIMISDSIGSSEMGASGSPAGAGQRFKLDREHVGARRRHAPDRARLRRRSAASPARVRSRSATTRTRPRPTPRSCPTPTACAGSIPGDFATVEEDGTIMLLGRGSACINTGGEKVYPDEVEAALKRHPGGGGRARRRHPRRALRPAGRRGGAAPRGHEPDDRGAERPRPRVRRRLQGAPRPPPRRRRSAAPPAARPTTPGPRRSSRPPTPDAGCPKPVDPPVRGRRCGSTRAAAPAPCGCRGVAWGSGGGWVVDRGAVWSWVRHRPLASSRVANPRVDQRLCLPHFGCAGARRWSAPPCP